MAWDAFTHHGFESRPMTLALASNASWRMVPIPQKGSSRVVLALHEARFIMIFASRGGMANILRWIGRLMSRFWNSNGLCTAVVFAIQLCFSPMQSSTSALFFMRFFLRTSTCVSCGCSLCFGKPRKRDFFPRFDSSCLMMFPIEWFMGLEMLRRVFSEQ